MGLLEDLIDFSIKTERFIILDLGVIYTNNTQNYILDVQYDKPNIYNTEQKILSDLFKLKNIIKYYGEELEEGLSKRFGQKTIYIEFSYNNKTVQEAITYLTGETKKNFLNTYFEGEVSKLRKKYQIKIQFQNQNISINVVQ